jgi:hypothetical protein
LEQQRSSQELIKGSGAAPLEDFLTFAPLNPARLEDITGIHQYHWIN